jgi:hypothetical protein
VVSSLQVTAMVEEAEMEEEVAKALDMVDEAVTAVVVGWSWW